MFPLFALLVAAEPPRTFDPEASLSIRVASGGEWDSNVYRALSRAAVGSARGVKAGGLVRLILGGDADVRLTTYDELRVAYVLGAKRFFTDETEDLLVNNLTISSHHGLGPLELSTRGQWVRSQVRSGLRDYGLLVGGASVGVPIGDRFVARVYGLGTWFEYSAGAELDYVGPTAGLEVVVRPIRGLELRAFGDLAFRLYDAPAIVLATLPGADGPIEVYSRCDGRDGIVPPACAPALRTDREVSIGLAARYRAGFLLASLELLARLQRSNSAFEEVDRYRATASVTTSLPLGVFAHVTGSLQLNRGLSLTQALNLAEDDENQNRIELGLRRAIFGGLEAEAKGALYANEFATADDNFLRYTVYLGVRYERLDL